MRLLVVTTFPPSIKPCSSFGYYSVLSFLESSAIDEIVILADELSAEEIVAVDQRLKIIRCWQTNRSSSVVSIIRKIVKYKPDVIWLNLQYTLFGPSPVPAFLGLLLPLYLRILGFNTIVLLHNYLAVIDIQKLQISIPWWTKALIKVADLVVMKSIVSANQIYVMEKSYYHDLTVKYPHAKIEFIEQDFFPISPFRPINRMTKHILTIGSFGTYKKLDMLLEAFSLVKNDLPEVALTIAGHSHPQNPNYLHELEQHSQWLERVHFAGYIPDDEIPELFWKCNLVVVTNSTSMGSSGVLRHSARLGRCLVAPNIDEFLELEAQGWGIVCYKQNDLLDLTSTLVNILCDSDRQLALAIKNYAKASSSQNQFLTAHFKSFTELGESRG